MKGDLRATEGISAEDQSWPWWPLLPLYPYGRRATHFEELIPGQIWSLEQLQGIYYVAVPVRLTVAKVPGGLMLINPLPPSLSFFSGKVLCPRLCLAFSQSNPVLEAIQSLVRLVM